MSLVALPVQNSLFHEEFTNTTESVNPEVILLKVDFFSMIIGISD